MKLSPKQLLAVQRSGQDVCVVAGPGSGKTRVLIERFRWLVEENNVSPLRILTITFTEKAATEIKERLAKAFEGNSRLRAEIERAYVSTIHGFCARLLRENAIAAGLDPGFSIMDAAASRIALEEAAHESLDGILGAQPAEMRRLLEAIHVSTYPGAQQPDLAGSLIGIYQAMRVAGSGTDGVRNPPAELDWQTVTVPLFASLRNAIEAAPPSTAKQRERIENLWEWVERGAGLAGVVLGEAHFRWLGDFPKNRQGLRADNALSIAIKAACDERIPDVAHQLAGAYYAPLHVVLTEAIQRIDQNYRQRKREAGALDFSDLEERAAELLRSRADIRSKVNAAFDQILMDELQDTNRLQWALLELARTPGGFFAVGDINQSIYGFRHAAPDVFLEYRRGIEAAHWEVEELYENHRSRAEILSAVDLVFHGAKGIEEHRLDARRKFAAKAEPSVELIVAGGDSKELPEIEAQWIARRIRELHDSLVIDEDGRGRSAVFRDFAVLARKASALRPIEQALGELGIPYLTSGGKEFFEAREVRDLVHLLRVLANARDEIALAGVLLSPLVGVGGETLFRLKRKGNLGGALAGIETREDLPSFDPDQLERLRDFRRLLKRLRAERDDVSADRLLLQAIDASGYRDGLAPRARANMDKLLAIVREWFERQPGPVSALVKHLSRLREFQAEPDAPPDDSSDVVGLMTIHQAKGLQFPVVLIPALQRGVDRSKPPICLSREGELGVCWRNPAMGGGVSDRVHARANKDREERGDAESSRLLYVAMTRAQEHLVLSFADGGTKLPPWPALVASGLGVELGAFDSQPVLHETPAGGLAIRLLRVNRPPERMAPLVLLQTVPEESTVIGRPSVTDQHDSAAAVTSLLKFAECPCRYYLSRYIGWREGPEEEAWLVDEDETEARESDEAGGMEFGSQVHALLAGEEVANAPDEAHELAGRFRRSELGRRAGRAGCIEREFDFLMEQDDVVLRGQIDLWFEEGGELILVDYKTDDVEAGAPRERCESYALQLRLYALALERLTGKLPDRAFVYLLRPDVAVPIDLGPERIGEALEVVKDFREAQSEARFDLHEGDHCHRCPFYRGLCPAGSVAGSRANHPS